MSASDAPQPTASAGLASSLGALVSPPLQILSRTLVELQESQGVLIGTIAAKRSELLEGSAAWLEAKAALDRLPEYLAKASRIAKVTSTTNALAARVERGSAALHARVDARDREHAERQSADAAGFAAVASR